MFHDNFIFDFIYKTIFDFIYKTIFDFIIYKTAINFESQFNIKS